MLDFQSRLLHAIHGIHAADLQRPEREGAWSIAQVIAHLADFELVTSWRIAMTLGEDEPELPRFRQEEWIARLHREQPLASVLEELWSRRRQNVRVIATLSDEDRQRRAIHARLGRITLAQLIEQVSEHSERHLKQIERIKSTLQLQTKTTSHLDGVTAARANGEYRSPGPGVRVYDLWSSGVRKALQVEFDPGAQWPGLDYHVPGPEDVYIVSGDFDDGENKYEAGTFLHHPAGSSHSPTSRNGCVLFVYYAEG